MVIYVRRLTGAVILLFPLIVCAASPLQTVETQVNQLLKVLGDPSLAGAAGEETKKATIRQISNNLFDFPTLSRFTLGRNWGKFSTKQQTDFIGLYRKLLESVYMGRLLEYQNETVVFEKQIQMTDTRAEVQTHIVTATKQIPIHYRLILKDGQWKVYDLIIENVSLVKNYRSQFDSILSRQTPEELLDILRRKTAVPA